MLINSEFAASYHKWFCGCHKRFEDSLNFEKIKSTFNVTTTRILRTQNNYLPRFFLLSNRKKLISIQRFEWQENKKNEKLTSKLFLPIPLSSFFLLVKILVSTCCKSILPTLRLLISLAASEAPVSALLSCLDLFRGCNTHTAS